MKFLLICLLLKIIVINCFVNITEFSIPDHIISGDSFGINCSYFISKDSLVSLEISKDEKPFYIYYPTGEPSVNLNSIEGIDKDQIIIDKKTHGKLMVLRANMKTEGLYECRIGSMKPMTASTQKSLKVFSAPEKRPIISDLRKRDINEEIIETRCLTEKSRPGVEFFWQINDRIVDQNSTLVQTNYSLNSDKLFTSSSAMKLTISELIRNSSKVINIKCIAIIDDWYRSSSDLLVINIDDYYEDYPIGKANNIYHNYHLVFMLIIKTFAFALSLQY